MSSNQALIDALTLRQIFIERYSKGEAGRLLSHLRRLSNKLQSTISSEYERVRAVRLAQQIAGITQTILDEYGDDMEVGLKQFAEAEAEFARQTLTATTAAEVISPGSLRQIKAAITKKPMKLIKGKATVELTIDQAAKQFSTAKAKQIAQIVRDGATIGRTSQEVTADIVSLVENRTRQQAASLVRTATNHIGNEARSLTYKANDDVITGEEFVATLDSHTTITCASTDGKVFAIGEGPIPPLHWGCVLPDTFVSAIGSVSCITKRPFNGQVVTLRTANGNNVTVTPNHPIMTDVGFIAAELIKQGDNLVCGLSGDTITSGGDDDEVVASIEDCFDSLIASGEMLACPMPCAAEDFHGDVAKDEVGIVLINIELLDSYVPRIAHKYVESFLKVGSVDSLISEPSFSHFSDFVWMFLSRGCCGVSISSESLDLLWARVVHSGLLLLRSISDGDTIIGETADYNTGRGSELFRNASATNSLVVQSNNGIEVKFNQFEGRIDTPSLKGAIKDGRADASFLSDFERLQPRIVEVDGVVEVSFSSFSGHVYNLECGESAFSANNIITHNCRSVRTPVINPEYNLGSAIEGERASSDGPVSAQTTYGGWLKRQSKEVQDEVLGVERAKLFRGGKLSIGKFTDDTGKVYTLEELKKLNNLV